MNSSATEHIRIRGVAAPLIRDDINTDSIIRSSDIDRPTRSGFGDKLFGGWRYGADRVTERSDFVLNEARYRESVILLAGDNFGCGSSREAAVWALLDFGIRSIVATGFGSIFHANCISNGLVPVVLSADELKELAAAAMTGGPTVVDVSRLSATVTAPDGQKFPFAVTARQRDLLLSGCDAVDLTMREHLTIQAFEDADQIKRPWIYELQRTDTSRLSAARTTP